MISILPSIIKLEQLNLSLQEITDRLIASFLSSKHNCCPKCNRKLLKRLCSYERNISDYRNGSIEDITIKTNRYICKCGSSHVLLPSLIIPCRRNSFILIVHALYDYYSHNDSVEGICRKYQISIPTLYRWKKCFEADKVLYLKSLKDMELSAYGFIRQILEEYDIRDFMNEFVKENPERRLFLQNMRKAHSQRKVKSSCFPS